MGNHHSHGEGRKEHAKRNSLPNVAKEKEMSRTASGADIQEKPSHLLPVERLAKILSKKCQEEEGVHGITQTVFTRYLFPRYPLLAEKLFQYFHQQSKSKNSHMSSSAFKIQCEKFLAILDDEAVLQLFVHMFSKDETFTCQEMTSLLMCTYHVSMDHYSEGPQMCLGIGKTLKAVVDSCFHAKSSLSWQYVANWLGAHCPRLVLPLHRFAIHSIATSWRVLETEGPPLAAGLELATPVLEQSAPLVEGKNTTHHILTMSMSWLLAGALPPLYSRPQRANSPSNSGVALSSQAFLEKLLCAVPSHWINLYDSDSMGLGTNRFLHHVLAYKGATLCLFKVDEGSVFCVACPNEWKESHLYWGGEETVLFQLLPTFSLLEKGSKMLYLNTTIRGYPQGLRVGKDPRAPIVSINAGFDKLEYRKIPYNLEVIEVWGCGDLTTRQVQLDVKKWEVKEAERQRCVKLSAADWLDHPDRYLLELAGRPQYHQNPVQ